MVKKTIGTHDFTTPHKDAHEHDQCLLLSLGGGCGRLEATEDGAVHIIEKPLALLQRLAGRLGMMYTCPQITQ